MTFKEYQKQYIEAVKANKVAEYPKEMFSDFVELADMYAEKIGIVLGKLKTSTNLNDIEKLPKIVDDLNTRAFNVLNNYKGIVEAVSEHNSKIAEQQFFRDDIAKRVVQLEKAIQMMKKS